MSFQNNGAGAPRIDLCRHGGSKLLFRGPRSCEENCGIAFLGSTEVFGRFVTRPFVDLLGKQLPLTCCNYGVVNAGIDSFLQDPLILRQLRKAPICVVQVMDAQNLSNRFFRVHPRRNDRFLEALPSLVALFPELDFTEFHFNRHLLSRLKALSAKRFARVCAELQNVWLKRMRLLLRVLCPCDVVLLHIGHAGRDDLCNLGADPVLVTPEMVQSLGALVSEIVFVTVQRAEQSQEVSEMRVGPMQAPIAEQSIGPSGHKRIADTLSPILTKLT
ncbi:MAG: DUF6473 family protein [Paracoccaceae bacterium]